MTYVNSNWHRLVKPHQLWQSHQSMYLILCNVHCVLYFKINILSGTCGQNNSMALQNQYKWWAILLWGFHFKRELTDIVMTIIGFTTKNLGVAKYLHLFNGLENELDILQVVLFFFMISSVIHFVFLNYAVRALSVSPLCKLWKRVING